MVFSQLKSPESVNWEKIQALGVINKNGKVFLYFRACEKSSSAYFAEGESSSAYFAEGESSSAYYLLLNSSKNYSLKVAIADKDEFHFQPHSESLVVKNQQGKEINPKDFQDFRITQLSDQYLLIYRRQVRGKAFLYAAWSKDLFDWQTNVRIANVNQIGMVVPDYYYQGRHALYFGGDSIKVAFSSDFRKWKVEGAPVFEPEEKDNVEIKIGDVFLTPKGILLLYFLFQDNQYFIKALLLDKNEPTKTLWPEAKTVWVQEEEWSRQPLKPIGMVKKDNRLISYWQVGFDKIYGLTHPYLLLFLTKKPRVFPVPLLKRLRNNPILRPIAKHFWESQLVFNPAAVYAAGRVHLVYRAVGEKGISVLGYASSPDGFQFDERLNKPIYVPREPFESTPPAPRICFASYMSGGGCGGCEDPKMTLIDDKIYMTYVAWDGWQPPRVALTSIQVDDFVAHRWHWQKPVLISPPGQIHKNWVIFPEKINGQYALLHSISPKISISYFNNLDFDGQTFINSFYSGVSKRKTWDSWVRGAGPPPIKTPKGWLVFYHAMDHQDPGRYKLGAMLLDSQEPTKILFRARNPILAPDETYENEGFKAGVIYATGAAQVNNRLFVYYGGADTVCCAATADMSQFLNQLKHNQTPTLEQVVI